MAQATRPQTLAESTDPIERELVLFDAAHPEAYDLLAALAHKFKRRGLSGVGIRRIFEELRFDLTIRTGVEGWEGMPRDALAPIYARLIMEREPGLAGYFTVRKRDALPGAYFEE